MVEEQRKQNAAYIQIIKDALNKHKLAFFIGSGVSKAANSAYPLWSEVLDVLKKDLVCCNETDSLKVAQLYYLKYGELELNKKVKACFPLRDEPGEIHRKILGLHPHYVLTTNWDYFFDNLINEDPCYLYDVIADDSGLVKSNNDDKIIKIHGDFDHKYVFKEDDYLNYSNNFPLIENFAKSIISTHVVVMLGYSFNDIDLKQIINWLQNNSKIQPPIYLVTSDVNLLQCKYLEKFGITSILLENENKTEALIDFISSIYLDDVGNKTPMQYVYDRIKKFENMPCVLQDQICNSLTNCQIDYPDSSKVVLHFFDEFLVGKVDPIKRKYYRNFVESLESVSKDDIINKIFKILGKANINAIMTTKDSDSPRRCFSFDIVKEDSSLLWNFEYQLCDDLNDVFLLKKDVKALYENEQYREAFFRNEVLVSLCKKTHNYSSLLIALFNYNRILSQLKYSFDSVNRNFSIGKNDIELEDVFRQLPIEIKKECSELIDFLSLRKIYEFQFKTYLNLKKKEDGWKNIENGGNVFCSNEGEYEARIENVMSYIFCNGICIEDDSVFREWCRHYIRITVGQKISDGHVKLNKLEMYICIRMWKTDDLKELFHDIILKKKKVPIEIDEANLLWLIDEALKNCIEAFKAKVFSRFEGYIERICFLISLYKLNDGIEKKIFNLFEKLVAEVKNTIPIFKAINSFFGVQWNLYSRKYEGKNILLLIEELLAKFASGNVNGNEDWALTMGGISNLYNYCGFLRTKFSSTKLLRKVLWALEEHDAKNKFRYCDRLLFDLYRISDKKCKIEIKNYLLKQKFAFSDDFGKNLVLLNYELSLIAYGMKKNHAEMIKKLTELLKNYPQNGYYFAIESTENLLSYLKKQNKGYEPLLSFISVKVNEYRGRKE